MLPEVQKMSLHYKTTCQVTTKVKEFKEAKHKKIDSLTVRLLFSF